MRFSTSVVRVPIGRACLAFLVLEVQDPCRSAEGTDMLANQGYVFAGRDHEQYWRCYTGDAGTVVSEDSGADEVYPAGTRFLGVYLPYAGTDEYCEID